MQDDLGFTYFYNMIKEYARISPSFTKNQIKEFIYDLKRVPSRFENFVMHNGDFLMKLTMTYPDIFKECLIDGLGKYSTPIDLMSWALFSGPEQPSTLTPMNPKIRESALNTILDSIDSLSFNSTDQIVNQTMNILLYFPTNRKLIDKFLNIVPTNVVSNEWLLMFIHRGNPQNIPYIVSYSKNREIVYQTPSFLSKSLPTFRQQLIEDESMLGPNDSRDQYYEKLLQLQIYIDQAKPIIRNANWRIIFWISRFIIFIRRFLQTYYEPRIGRGYLAGAAAWKLHTISKIDTEDIPWTGTAPYL